MFTRRVHRVAEAVSPAIHPLGVGSQRRLHSERAADDAKTERRLWRVRRTGPQAALLGHAHALRRYRSIANTQ